MNEFPVLDNILRYGFELTEACWPALAVLCALGLVFMSVGNRLSMPGQALINRTMLCIMVATLVFSIAFLALAIFATSIDRYAGYIVLLFSGMMLIPFILSVLGLLVTRYSPFAVQRQRTPL
jgi:hypothetical protein